MKNILTFSACFILGVCALVGGALFATHMIRAEERTAFIDASAVEPAAGEEAIVDQPADSGDLMPVTANQATAVEDIDASHPVLRLTPDKTEMVKLDADAQSVIIGNPDHASVLMENPRLLLVVPRKPGATYFSVLDKDGEIVMQRHVVVAAPKEKYVRIRRSCANASRQGNCEPVTVYYCPDMCHEVSTDANAGSGSRRR